MRTTQAAHPKSKKGLFLKKLSQTYDNITATNVSPTSLQPNLETEVAEDEYTSTVATTSSGKRLSYTIDGILGIKFPNLKAEPSNPNEVNMEVLVQWSKGSEPGEDFCPSWEPWGNVDCCASVVALKSKLVRNLNVIIAQLQNKGGRRANRKAISTLSSAATSGSSKNKNARKRKTSYAGTNSMSRKLTPVAFKSHASGAVHACPTCKKKFTRNTNMQRHISISHGNKVPQFSCEHCERKFHTKQDQQRHLDTHRTGPRVACGQCDRTLRNLETLRKHTAKMHKLL